MNTSPNGIELIKGYEGFRGNPYKCPADVPTIGYGSTYYEDGTAVSMDDEPITSTQAESLLRYSLKGYEASVQKLVTVALKQGQFDALVSFVYNLGAGALKGSTLLKKLNAGDYKGAAEEFGKWTHGGGKVLPGLVKRRAAEKALFVS